MIQNFTDNKKTNIEVKVETPKEEHDRLVKELNKKGHDMKYIKKRIHELKKML